MKLNNIVDRMLQLHNLLIFLFSLKALLQLAASSKVATTESFPSCSEKDENINNCLINVVAELIPRSKNGIPEINIPPMDPLSINRTTYIFSHPLVQGKITARNIKIHGLSGASTESLNYKRTGNQVNVTVKAKLPYLFVEGQYKAKVKINSVNISSKGPFNVTFDNILVTVKTISDLVQHEDGHRYMNVKSLNFDPTVGNMKFSAEGLLSEPLLNDAIIEFINQNWRTVYKSLIAETRAAWEPEILRINHAYFAHVPIDVVIKD